MAILLGIPEGQQAEVVVEDAAAVEHDGRDAPHLLHPRLDLAHERALRMRRVYGSLPVRPVRFVTGETTYAYICVELR